MTSGKLGTMTKNRNKIEAYAKKLLRNKTYKHPGYPKAFKILRAKRVGDGVVLLCPVQGVKGEHVVFCVWLPALTRGVPVDSFTGGIRWGKQLFNGRVRQYMEEDPTLLYLSNLEQMSHG